MNYKNPMILVVGIIVGAAGMWAVPQLFPCKGPAPKPEPVLDEAAAKLPENDMAAFKAIGTMCAEKMRLAVGFNDRQIGWISEGFKQGLAGAPASESFREDIGRAEKVYKTYAEKAAAVRKAKAEENEKLADAYINALPDKNDLQKTESGLYYKIIAPGDPAKKPTRADHVKVSYTGTLINGKVFDETKKGVEMPLNGTVKGFMEGLQLIGVGGKIKLYVPGKLGYRENPPPESGIQPGDMLIFDIELLDAQPIKPLTKARNRNRPAGTPPAGLPEGLKVPPAPPTTRPPSLTPPPIPPELLKKHPNLPANMKPPALAKVEAPKEAPITPPTAETAPTSGTPASAAPAEAPAKAATPATSAETATAPAVTAPKAASEEVAPATGSAPAETK
jgi:FKBP-type peptidyl-prolyl cis-trans isomerase